MPVPNEKNKSDSYKKQRRWSLIGILTKKKKFKKSQDSVDFCPYDGKINQKIAQKNNLERSTDCLIEQYTCSPKLIRRCNSLQYTSQVPTYSNITSHPKSNDWKSSQQSVYSSSSSACYSDIDVYRNYGYSNQSSYYIKENYQTSPILQNVPFRCSSDIGHYQDKTNCNQRYHKLSLSPKKCIGKKIPPPPPPRDPNVKAVYYFRNNRLMSRESDSTYFSQGSDNIPGREKIHESEIEYQNEYCIKEPPRSRRPIQICDIETLSTESENSVPKVQSVEEALQELEDIYNSLGLSDEDLLDRAERRDLPTVHQNMRYQNVGDLDCINVRRVLPKVRRSCVPDIIFDDMAYRRLNKRESKQQHFFPGSFLLVLPTIHNLDQNSKSSREPDITLDDVVFRNRRQHINFLKISDPQPPFGIPLGPIVGAAPSDYLHAVPEGRYKPAFHPRKVPDTVEDDLAFRTLRKDEKYKTCINVSFGHGNRFKINGPIPKSGSKLNNDLHWIAKKTSTDRFNNKSKVKLTFDDLTHSIADDRQNMMVVKIKHRKPIMLTGFTLNETNQLSKSFFCTNLLQHESRKICLTNDTCMPNNAPQLKHNYSLYALNQPNNMNSLPVSLIKSKNYHENNTPLQKGECKKLNTEVHLTNLDNDGLMCKGLVGKNQPNFRELIKREYAHRYPSTENQSNTNLVLVNRSAHVVTASDRHTLHENKYRFVNDSTRTVINSNPTAGALGQTTETGRRSSNDERQSSDETAALAESRYAPNAPKNRTEASSNSEPEKDSSLEWPNHMPGYLEVCLYITVYIYQLFSVNAYSTIIALIFLVALHVYRRLS